MAASPRLVVLSSSPWSERARWALDHHRLSYRTVEHVPFIGELRVRRLVGPHKGRATVPVLIDRDEVLTESWDIAKYADRKGTGPKLIPADRESEVRTWNDLADKIAAEGRGLTIFSLLRNPGAVDEGLPFPLPSWLRPAMRPITRVGMRWFAKKYGLREEEAPQREKKMRDGLATLRAALATGSPYLLGSFSYADIAMATVLQGVSPVADEYIPLGPATREAWTFPNLANEFADLMRWRDALYRQHRSRRHENGQRRVTAGIH